MKKFIMMEQKSKAQDQIILSVHLKSFSENIFKHSHCPFTSDKKYTYHVTERHRLRKMTPDPCGVEEEGWVCMFLHLRSSRKKVPQQRELISLLLHPHLQHALDRPTTTSLPLRSALRRASKISSVMKDRADLLNTSSWWCLGGKLSSLFLCRKLSMLLWLKPSGDSSWWELNGSSKTSDAAKWTNGSLRTISLFSYTHLLLYGDCIIHVI